MPENNNPFRGRLQERRSAPNPFRGQSAQSPSASASDNETSAFGSFMTRLLKGTGDAVLATPSATGDLLAMGAAGAEGTARGLVPGGEGFEYGRRYREQQEQFPASAIRAIPRPTTDEVIAGGRASLAAVPGGASPGEQFQWSMDEAEQQRQRQYEEHPIAATAGDVGGSVASLLLTKSPLQSTIRRAEKQLTRRPDMYFGGARSAEAAPTVSTPFKRALSSNLARYGARGGFRAGETGLEAAYLEVVNEAENDPLLAAGLAAGGQIGGSLSLEALKHAKSMIPGRPGLSLGVSALSAAGLWQMFKSATPGGKDYILESLESGYDKVTYATLLGALGGSLGAARGRGSEVYEAWLPVSEAAMTVPRAGVMGLLTEKANAPEEEQQRFEATLERIMNDPDFEPKNDFEREIANRLAPEESDTTPENGGD